MSVFVIYVICTIGVISHWAASDSDAEKMGKKIITFHLC